MAGFRVARVCQRELDFLVYYCITLYAVDRGHHSYVAMIAKAILSSPRSQLPLTEIYAFIGTAFFPRLSIEDGRAWRNNIRHHLSVNDCFVKVGGRRARGHGSLWTIHPDCVERFRRGDFRRRRWTARPGPRRHHTDSTETGERYVTMRQTISPSDELYAHLVSSGVFAKLKFMCFQSKIALS